MFTYKMILARKYRNEAGDDGGGSTTVVDTVLTGDAGAADDSGTDNSDSGADAPGDDAVKLDADAGKNDGGESPDTYADFVIPEGMELDETALADALPLFKELELTQEQSQKVIDLYAKQVQAGSQMQTDNFNQLMNDWREQSKNDSEFGGDKYDENVKVAQHAISKYGTPELKQLLNDHGVGNHPEMVRFMVKVGRTLSEDVPGNIGDTTSNADDAVSILYPNDN